MEEEGAESFRGERQDRAGTRHGTEGVLGSFLHQALGTGLREKSIVCPQGDSVVVGRAGKHQRSTLQSWGPPPPLPGLILRVLGAHPRLTPVCLALPGRMPW